MDDWPPFPDGDDGMDDADRERPAPDGGADRQWRGPDRFGEFVGDAREHGLWRDRYDEDLA